MFWTELLDAEKRINTQQIEVSLQHILDSDHVTRLILLQQLFKLGLVDYSPLDDPEFVAAVGGEGVEPPGDSAGSTGPDPQKIFSGTGKLVSGGSEELLTGEGRESGIKWAAWVLERTGKIINGTDGVGAGEYVVNPRSGDGDPWGTAERWRRRWEGYNPMGSKLLEKLKGLEIYRIEVRLLDRFERRVLGRVEEVMEVDRKARAKFKRNWIRKERKRAKAEKDAYGYRLRKKHHMEIELMKKKLDEVQSQVVKEPPIERDSPPNGQVVDETKEEPVMPVAVSEKGEVELEVIRIGPNPRILVCRWNIEVRPVGGGEPARTPVTVHVFVKTTKNFRKGMKFRMEEQEGVEWKYEGKLPRYMGRF